MEFESIDPNPERADSLIVSFKERYMAEQLMHGKSEIPSIGSVELSWVAGPSPPDNTYTRHRSDGDMAMGDGGSENEQADIGVGDANGGEADEGEKETAHDVEYDVAEDNDWGIA